MRLAQGVNEGVLFNSGHGSESRSSQKHVGPASPRGRAGFAFGWVEGGVGRWGGKGLVVCGGDVVRWGVGRLAAA